MLWPLPLSVRLLLDSWVALPEQLVSSRGGKPRNRSQAGTSQLEWSLLTYKKAPDFNSKQ